MRAMRIRRYGTGGPQVVLLHGGPGAPGSLAGLARALATDCRVVEHLQPTWEQGGRTVADHVEDVRATLEELGIERPHLVGWSWGAMLGLAFAAERLRPLANLILIGSGTFDLEARAELVRRRDARQEAPEVRDRIAEIRARLASDDPLEADRALGELGQAMTDLDLVDPLPAEADDEARVTFDRRGHESSWNDMLRLQGDGTYPARFARIEERVVMLHGEEDTHPGRLIHASLAPHVGRLEFVEFPRCGHYPWRERQAREPFLRRLLELVGASQ